MLARNSEQHRCKRLAGRAHVVGPLPAESIEIFLQQELSMTRDQQALNIQRVVRWIDMQNFFDQLRQRFWI